MHCIFTVRLEVSTPDLDRAIVQGATIIADAIRSLGQPPRIQITGARMILDPQTDRTGA